MSTFDLLADLPLKVEGYGLEGLRFTKPVYPGDTMQVMLTCKQKTEKETPSAGTGAGIPQGAPHAGVLPKELQHYAGKPWGELPGELRTKILQDMKSQYGDDYARIIKLYFEQIAERK